MCVVGIVTTFNPLHKGHQYLLDKTRPKLRPKAITFMMNGLFVPYGDPALCNSGSEPR